MFSIILCLTLFTVASVAGCGAKETPSSRDSRRNQSRARQMSRTSTRRRKSRGTQRRKSNGRGSKQATEAESTKEAKETEEVSEGPETEEKLVYSSINTSQITISEITATMEWRWGQQKSSHQLEIGTSISFSTVTM